MSLSREDEVTGLRLRPEAAWFERPTMPDPAEVERQRQLERDGAVEAETRARAAACARAGVEFPRPCPRCGELLHPYPTADAFCADCGVRSR